MTKPTIAITIGQAHYRRMMSQAAWDALATFADVIHHSGPEPATKEDLLALLSAAALAFEITLTRLFSVTQAYHFAFLAVSVALLGYGASGTGLSLVPAWSRPPAARRGLVSSSLFAAAVVAAYLCLNYLPFDSYRIAWQRIQLLYLVLYYLALTVPFFCAGLVTGLLLATYPAAAGRLYAARARNIGRRRHLPAGRPEGEHPQQHRGQQRLHGHHSGSVHRYPQRDQPAAVLQRFGDQRGSSRCAESARLRHGRHVRRHGGDPDRTAGHAGRHLRDRVRFAAGG